jgi:peptidoglycan glycosyltransferase
LLQNNRNEASQQLTKIESSIYHPKAKKELRALIFLFSNELIDAISIFQSLTRRSNTIEFHRFLEYFSDNAEYKKLRIYTDYLVKVGIEIPYYQILYNTGLFNHQRSTEIISQLPQTQKKRYERELNIIRNLNSQIKSGKIDYVYDINGMPLAYFDVKKKKTVSLTPGMTFDELNEDFKKSIKIYGLTIDHSLQKKLHRLFKNYHGSFLLFNLNDTSILAAYSKPADKKAGNAVFRETYEPGSIIKILTLLSYLQSSKQDLFPYQCKGNISLGGKIFYDWLKHDTINNYQKAFTVSCNLSFAAMGIKVGIEKMRATFQKFFFNSQSFEDLSFKFRTGSINESISNDFKLANLSVGLNEISTTTFHSALISSIVCQNGSIYPPYIIKNIKNILNLGFYNHGNQLVQIINDNPNFLKIKNAMIQVVEDPKGTGRRTHLDFVTVGLKTGTTGSRKSGFNSILTGFFPTVRTKYTFSFRLEKAGKAELAGANFLKDFLHSFYDKKKN